MISKNLLILSILLIGIFSCMKEENNTQINFTDQSYGCGNFLVYKLTDDLKGSIVVNGILNNVREISYELSSDSAIYNTTQIVITRFDRKVDNYYCTFSDTEPVIINQWFAKKGKVEISLTSTDQVNQFKIKIVLTNMKFYDTKDDIINIDYLEFQDVIITL